MISVGGPINDQIFYLAGIAALGLIAAVTLISLSQHKVNAEQMWTSLYVFTICLVAGALFTAVKNFEPNRLLALVLMLLILGAGAAAVARHLGL